MPVGFVTSRSLQNEATGIDLQVPLYQEVRGTMMTGHVEYQILVISRLSAFKSAKHKPGDVVQLVVSKKYSEIDEFYSTLITQYPSIHLPSMPRKALFVGEADIRERRTAFDELVRFISKHSTLSTCPELMEFLGATRTAHDLKSSTDPGLREDEDDELDFFGKEEADVQPEPVKKPVKVEQAPEDVEEEDEEELFDPLGSVRTKKPKAGKPVPKPAVKPKPSLFDEEEDSDQELFQPPVKDGNVKLFEDPDLGGAVTLGDSLLLPNAYKKSGASAATKPDEDVEELFRVEEDFDKLLTIHKSVKTKPAVASKPAVKAKPVIPQKTSSVTQAGRGLPEPGNAQTMDNLDILKYIEQNEAATVEDLDLF